MHASLLFHHSQTNRPALAHMSPSISVHTSSRAPWCALSLFSSTSTFDLGQLTLALPFHFAFAFAFLGVTISYHVSPISYHVITYHLSPISYHIITYHIITYHLSLTTYHLSPITYHISLINPPAAASITCELVGVLSGLRTE